MHKEYRLMAIASETVCEANVFAEIEVG